MARFVLMTVTLTAVYLLVLTSVQPGDVLLGATLSVVIAAALVRAFPAGRVDSPLGGRLAAAPGLAVKTVAGIVRGTWHVALYTLGRRRLERPGLVAIPKEDRTPSGVAAWGFLTALSPDEIVVDIDEQRGVLLVHVLDAGDPEAIRVRHHEAHERRQRRVFP
jgi:multisubunit Na+/H+ antiporter MnhE subunit